MEIAHDRLTVSIIVTLRARLLRPHRQLLILLRRVALRANGLRSHVQVLVLSLGVGVVRLAVVKDNGWLVGEHRRRLVRPMIRDVGGVHDVAKVCRVAVRSGGTMGLFEAGLPTPRSSAMRK